MNRGAMEIVSSRLDHKMKHEKGNATCHPEMLQKALTSIKLVFIPKIRYHECNLTMQVSLSILKTSTENYFFIL